MSKGSFRHRLNRTMSTICAVALVSATLSGAAVANTAVLANTQEVSGSFDVNSARVVLNMLSEKSLTRVSTTSNEGTYVKPNMELASQVSGVVSGLTEMNELQLAKKQEQQRIAEERAEAIRLEEERIRAEEEARLEAERIAAEEAERQRQEEERRRQEALILAEQTDDNVPNWASGCNSNFKAYMGYNAVTCVSSPQYKLLNGESAYTDVNTGVRMVDGRYCIAVGSYYTTTVGQKLDLYLETGVVIPCIVGDCKADCHTNSESHQFCLSNGSVAEFIVDYSVFNYLKDGSGTVNWCVGDCGSFNGRINKIVLVN